MPDDIKIEDLFIKHRSEPRNPNIANVFFRCGYIESWGRGSFKIKELCKQVNANLPEPENLNGGISVVCNASKQYLELAEKYGVDSQNFNPSNKPKNEGLNEGLNLSDKENTHLA